MIEQNNLNYNLTSEMRRTILQRAVYTQPFFYKTNIDIGVSADIQSIFQSVIGVNRDFFLTEYQGNLTEVFNSIGIFNISIYTGRDRSVYHYNNLAKLPSGLVLGDARQDSAAGKGVDRQQEKYPFLIRRNDKIYVEVNAINAEMQDARVEIVLKGFNVLDNRRALTPMQTEQCNASLARPVEWQHFKLNIDKIDSKAYVIENDNKPRVLLGFGSVNEVENRPYITATITDLTRRLQFSETPIRLDFIAPRIPVPKDTHIYYLPVEYYLEPYAKMQFEIGYIPTEEFVPVEISMLTRTV